jgi:hypothetical protein
VRLPTNLLKLNPSLSLVILEAGAADVGNSKGIWRGQTLRGTLLLALIFPSFQMLRRPPHKLDVCLLRTIHGVAQLFVISSISTALLRCLKARG